jgi:hypothetical protein
LTKSTSFYLKAKNSLAICFIAFNLLFLIPFAAAEEAPPEVTVIETAGGDDVSYQIPLTVSVIYDGVTYQNVYATTNSVITFGSADGTYWDYPTTPSISIESKDWWVIPQRMPDTHFILSVSQGGFQVDGAYRPYGIYDGEVTNIVITAQIQTDGTMAYTYAVSGPLAGDERTGARLTDGTVVTLEQAGVTQVEEPPVLEPEPVPPTPTPSPEPEITPTPLPTPDTSTVVAPEPTPVPIPEPSPTDEPDPESNPEPTPEPVPVEPEPQPLPVPIPVPVPEPEPIPVVPVPEPSVVDQPPEPSPEPEPEPVLEPQPEPEPEPVELEPVPEPLPIEEEPLAPELPSEPPVVEPEPPAVADEDSTPKEKETTAETLIKEADGEAVTAEAIAKAGLTYNDLPPQTPVQVRQDENGNEVVITAEVAAALVVLKNPAALVEAIFTNPAQALLALGSIGADMSDEEREESQKTIVAAVIVGGIATQSALTVAASAGAVAYRRKP